MSVLVAFFEFVARAGVITLFGIFAGFCIVRYAVDYAFKAKQGYMNQMIDKATKVGVSVDLGIQ